MGKNLRHAAIALLLITTAIPSAGQNVPSRLAFEVATIKRSGDLNAGGSAGFQPGGRFRVVNLPVINLIMSAFGAPTRSLLRSQVVGGPEWLMSDRYDIIAKLSDQLAAGSPAELYPKMPQLLQSLLEDRFKLKTHRDTRQLPIFALHLARRDGALGPQMRRSTARCPEERDKCSLRFRTGRVTGGSVGMENIVMLLSGNVDRVVVDRTRLEGKFEVDLEWSPDQSEADKPSIFTAVQEQLGLKLESDRGPVDVVVIDQVERPTED